LNAVQFTKVAEIYLLDNKYNKDKYIMHGMTFCSNGWGGVM